MTILIEQKEVNIPRLCIELEQAVINYSLEKDDSIYVNEGVWFPYWIELNAEHSYVFFRSYIEFRDGSSRIDQLELCNNFNKGLHIVTASVVKVKGRNRMFLDRTIGYRDGILRETFIRDCRQFSESITMAWEKYDPKHAITYRLNESPESTANE